MRQMLNHSTPPNDFLEKIVQEQRVRVQKESEEGKGKKEKVVWGRGRIILYPIIHTVGTKK